MNATKLNRQAAGASLARRIDVSLTLQRLRLFDADEIIMDVAVSTSVQGAGEQLNSGCTPRGRHVVRAMIGAGMPINTVFLGRRATGEVYTPFLGAKFSERDWILTRILWLSGLEVGHNRLGSVDSMRRYIYIHGCPDSLPMGTPGSGGCVRMRNADVVELFDRVTPETIVNIHE